MVPFIEIRLQIFTDHIERLDDHVVSLKADCDGEVDGASEADVGGYSIIIPDIVLPDVGQGEQHRDQPHIPVSQLRFTNTFKVEEICILLNIRHL